MNFWGSRGSCTKLWFVSETKWLFRCFFSLLERRLVRRMHSWGSSSATSISLRNRLDPLPCFDFPCLRVFEMDRPQPPVALSFGSLVLVRPRRRGCFEAECSFPHSASAVPLRVIRFRPALLPEMTLEGTSRLSFSAFLAVGTSFGCPPESRALRRKPFVVDSETWALLADDLVLRRFDTSPYLKLYVVKAEVRKCGRLLRTALPWTRKLTRTCRLFRVSLPAAAASFFLVATLMLLSTPIENEMRQQQDWRQWHYWWCVFAFDIVTGQVLWLRSWFYRFIEL